MITFAPSNLLAIQREKKKFSFKYFFCSYIIYRTERATICSQIKLANFFFWNNFPGYVKIRENISSHNHQNKDFQ